MAVVCDAELGERVGVFDVDGADTDEGGDGFALPTHPRGHRGGRGAHGTVSMPGMASAGTVGLSWSSRR